MFRSVRRPGQSGGVHGHQGAPEEGAEALNQYYHHPDLCPGPDDGQDAPLRPGLQGAAEGADPGRARGVRLPVLTRGSGQVRRHLQREVNIIHYFIVEHSKQRFCWEDKKSELIVTQKSKKVPIKPTLLLPGGYVRQGIAAGSTVQWWTISKC